ncbi:hypothetical protein [Microseira wollei]|uniref:Bacteriocin n=1 Tax=Microseira wollei NIES-4236 TaxID=2530354 RepID=A0AAV3X7G3_9CYAN|nr:hypothetical protein [Microseira wollei]GET36142.1 hypothetical protein MiSe_08900 [Microseira wollei NIES-4236]
MAKIQVVDLHPSDSKNLNNSSYLTDQELDLIKGGLQLTPLTPVSAAIRTFPGLGYIVGAFTAGYKAGEWLNENTPIQSWISERLTNGR